MALLGQCLYETKSLLFSLYVKSKAWNHMFHCSGKSQITGNSVSQDSSTSQVWKATRVTPIGHSVPHDLWGPGQYKATSPPPRSLSSIRLWAEGRPASLAASLTGEAWFLQVISSLRVQLYERSAKVQLPAHLTKETSSQLKLYQTPSSNSMSCRGTSTSNWVPQPNRTTKVEIKGPARRLHRIANWTATSFFPFPRTSNTTGLNNYTRLSKTVYSIFCGVYKFDLCCDTLVISYSKVILIC